MNIETKRSKGRPSLKFEPTDKQRKQFRMLVYLGGWSHNLAFSTVFRSKPTSKKMNEMKKDPLIANIIVQRSLKKREKRRGE